MPESKNIAILGLGWLGLPLAQALHKKRYSVKGSVSSRNKLDQLEGLPFDVTKIVINESEILGDWDTFIQKANLLIVNLPPGRTEGVERTYPAWMDQIVDRTSPKRNVIFTSTTGVYADENQKVDENIEPNPTRISGKAVLDAERRLAAYFGKNLTILRLAGLIGEDRHPGRFMAGKKGLKNGNAPVNLVHQEDCIGIIQKVIEQNTWGKVINLCASKHPIKKDYYRKAASALGLEPPTFKASAEATYKMVDNRYGRELLEYVYQYDDPEDIFIEKDFEINTDS